MLSVPEGRCQRRRMDNEIVICHALDEVWQRCGHIVFLEEHHGIVFKRGGEFFAEPTRGDHVVHRIDRSCPQALEREDQMTSEEPCASGNQHLGVAENFFIAHPTYDFVNVRRNKRGGQNSCHPVSASAWRISPFLTRSSPSPQTESVARSRHRTNFRSAR